MTGWDWSQVAGWNTTPLLQDNSQMKKTVSHWTRQFKFWSNGAEQSNVYWLRMSSSVWIQNFLRQDIHLCIHFNHWPDPYQEEIKYLHPNPELMQDNLEPNLDHTRGSNLFKLCPHVHKLAVDESVSRAQIQRTNVFSIDLDTNSSWI